MHALAVANRLVHAATNNSENLERIAKTAPDKAKEIRVIWTSPSATRLQEVIFGIMPQVMPLWSSFTLYRFETNVRSATVLGIVGAGGIGHSLYENIRSFHYSETAAIVIIVVVTVMLIDLVSARIRKALV